jgi:hypothetical protein
MTRLAFRVWRFDRRRGVLLSVNAGGAVRPKTWFLPTAIASPEGDWPPGRLLIAQCSRGGNHEEGVPDPDCSCGIYATTSLDIVNEYLCDESPVLGVVELGGRTIPATSGYRAEAARVAAILVVDEIFTLPHSELARIAKAYGVPALVPHSVDPEVYLPALQSGGLSEVDWDAELRRLSGKSGG